MRHQLDMQTKITGERAGQEVVRWRRAQLAEAGFPLPIAARLAKDARYDLHALIELVERGCPPHLAERIVAPLSGGIAA